MELRENLELVAVEYENDNKKAVMTFLDRERKEVRVVNFNKQSYKDGKYVNDPEKENLVDEWCKTYFGVSFEKLPGCVGTVHDIYTYPTFNSLWEAEFVEKFTEDMEGQIYQTTWKGTVVDDNAIRIRFDIDGKTYESKMNFGMYIESTKEWFVDPLKKQKAFEKFKDKFGVPVEEADTLIGHNLMVEVKKAMGKYLYGDIKKFPKTK